MRASGFRPCPTLRPYCRSKWRELDGFGFGASWAPTIPSHCVCACWFCIVIGFEPPVQSQLQILIMTQQRNGKGERFGVVGILSPLFLILPQVSGQSLSPVLMHFLTIEMKMHALIYRLPTQRKPQTCKMSPAENVIYAQSLGKCRSTDKGAGGSWRSPEDGVRRRW